MRNLVFCAAVLGACTSSSAKVAGQVIDLNALPIANVQVSTGGTATRTGVDGTYSLSLDFVGPTTVAFAAQEWAGTRQRVTTLADKTVWLPVTLARRAGAQALSADEGGSVVGPRGSAITAPARAFVDAASGAAVSGPMTIALTPLDPTVEAELSAYPGQLMALRSDGSYTILGSLGAIEIDAEQAGRPLALAAGATLTLRLPAPAIAELPPTAGLWSFDAGLGLWREEPGQMTLDGDSYVAEIAHLSWYNCDLIRDVGCVKGRVVDCDGKPVAGVQISSRCTQACATYASYANDFTDDNGRYSAGNQQGRPIQLKVRPPYVAKIVYVDVQNGDTRPDIVAGFIDKNDPACRDVEDIVIGNGCKNGVKGGTDDSSASCTAIGAAPDGGVPDGGLAGSCTRDMAGIFACWGVKGACPRSVTQTGNGVIIVYDNGAKMMWTSDPANSSTMGTFYGPSGTVCGTMDSDGSTLTISDGSKRWTFEPDPNGGERLRCPDGTVEHLAGADATGITKCTSSAGIPGCSTGNFDQCESDLDCAAVSGFSCCKTRGGNLCVYGTDACANVQEFACANDADCTWTFATKCCFGGHISMCQESCD